MDEPIERAERWKMMLPRLLAITLGGALVLAGAIYSYGLLLSDDQNLERFVVQKMQFIEKQDIRSVAVPTKSVVLEAEEGGRLVAKLLEPGDSVEVGTLVARLDNPGFRLELTSREAEVSEQVNNLRNTRLAMERDTLAIQQELSDIEYNIERLTRELDRKRPLAEQQLLPADQIDDLDRELALYQRLQEIVRKRQVADQAFRNTQVDQLESTVERLTRQVLVAKQSLENLNVRAPIAGVLTSLDGEIGEHIRPGDRIGVIDSTGAYQLLALVPEFYLNRIAPGQTGVAHVNQNEVDVEVSKVFPHVENGQFEVRFDFQPMFDSQTLRRGQTIRVEIFFGDANDALAVPSSYVTVEGGGYFTLVEEGSRKELRPVVLGRRTNQYVEILEGLDAGETVLRETR